MLLQAFTKCRSDFSTIASLLVELVLYQSFSHFTTVIILKKERREVIKIFGRLIVGSFIGWKLKFNLIMCHLFQVSSLKSKRFSCKG